MGEKADNNPKELQYAPNLCQPEGHDQAAPCICTWLPEDLVNEGIISQPPCPRNAGIVRGGLTTVVA